MIGFIFPVNKLNRIISGTEKNENIQYYYDLAKENKSDLVFYSLKRLDLEKVNIKGFFYSYKEKKLKEQTLPIPKINLVRVILHNKKLYNKLKEMEQNYNIKFINLIPERNKYIINKFLLTKDEVKSFIPESELLSYETFIKFLDKYNKVFIKPINGALGQRIMAVEKQGDLYTVQNIYKNKQLRESILKNQLHDFFNNHFKNPKGFMIQPWIPFKKYQNNKFDVRTSIQKNKNGKWKITGIVARTAKKDGIVTNVAKGGSVVPYAQIKSEISRKTHNKINQLSIKIASYLEQLYPSTADLGLDIGIDDEDNLWFIEANYCDQRYAYREANNFDMWYRTYKTPFEYGLFTMHSNHHQLLDSDQ